MSKLGIINANFIYVAMMTSGIYFEFQPDYFEKKKKKIEKKLK